MFSVSALMRGDYRDAKPDRLWAAIEQNFAVDEAAWVEELLLLATPAEADLRATTDRAKSLVERVRATDDSVHMVDALLQEYSLDTREGIILMCLAEALMRIPDKATQDALISDRLSGADWDSHLGHSASVLVNASTWGLLLTGKVITLDTEQEGTPSRLLNRLVKSSGEPVIRKAMHHAMRIMGRQFVLGRDIEEAIGNGLRQRRKGYSYSYDMLGEAALTQADAERYFESYHQAIAAVGKNARQHPELPASGVSIKLSALHPRYEAAQCERVLSELFATVHKLLSFAREQQVPINIDAEEMDRLEISLRLFEKLYQSDANRGTSTLGLVVQAYSKRALPILAWLASLAREQGDRIPMRLVKGAYWDSEIKLAQQRGQAGYPVFTRKEATDVSYLACARYLFSEVSEELIYPQFATHNAHTVAAILNVADKHQRPFEFQRLHGMGDALYDCLLEDQLRDQGIPVRIYAPVGAHKDLLPYLVRRLLENGANSSFVHRLVDADTPVSELIQHPALTLRQYKTLPNERIPLPPRLFPDRQNSHGYCLFAAVEFTPLNASVRQWDTQIWRAQPLINGQAQSGLSQNPVMAPHQSRQQVGTVEWAGVEHLKAALDGAAESFPDWNARGFEARAKILERIADAYETHMPELIALCCREAGKTWQDSIDEIREAVDFCRYYAQIARNDLGIEKFLPGYTGEQNILYHEGRGVFVCISPWNFPLAIFTGQIVAALVSGNTVIAKPAEQTSLIACRAAEIMHQCGVPGDVLQLVTGDGAKMAADLLSDTRVAGVVFTGSTAAAHSIQRQLAKRAGAIPVLIAETGGQNCMIVDSTALPEQVVKDVLQSAFASAGQRCSALRVLFVQEEIADALLELLSGAIRELRVGDPANLSTDVGPVIDKKAQEVLQTHVTSMSEEATWQARAPNRPDLHEGTFIRPTVFEIENIEQLSQEFFGPVLHVIRYAAKDLDRVIAAINATGYGLTLGIHSRNESKAASIERRVKVGNTYINRNQIGAVVGVQPFGGRGLSGTGPKAGGPQYLHRFVNERVKTINTTAVGGNATLLSLREEDL